MIAATIGRKWTETALTGSPTAADDVAKVGEWDEQDGLNYMGRHGWELIDIDRGTGSYSERVVSYYFKRPAE